MEYKHTDLLADEIIAPVDTILHLIDDNSAQAIREGFVAEGRPGLWRRVKESRWRTRWASIADEQIWLDLFRVAFGSDMDPRLWRWKYGQANPIGTAVWHGEQAVAFYGGMPRPIRFFGRDAMAVQIGDVMVHPKERGVLTRNGPIFLATATFLERCIGFDRPYLVGFGFPTKKAMQVAVRLGLYDEVGTVAEVHWPAQDGLPSLWVCARLLQRGQISLVDDLWSEMADAMPECILGVRGGTFINRRYLDHPLICYTVLLVSQRWGGKSIGLVVLRVQQATVELVDLVGPPSRFGLLVMVARRFTAKAGKQRLSTLATSNAAAMLSGDSGMITPTDFVIPANRWNRGPDAGQLRDRWWLMTGDADFG